MAKNKLNEIVAQVSDIELSLEKDLTKFSTMRLRATGDLITVKSVDSLKKLLPLLSESNIEYRVLGWGANQLLPEEITAPYLMLDLPFDKSYLDEVRDIYELPASVSIPVLSSHAVKNGLRGWEVFTGVPASLGGAIFMNAGTNLGEICEVVQEVSIISTDGKQRDVAIDKNSFSYRKNHFLKKGEVIVSAKLFHHGKDSAVSNQIKDYLALRNRTQPLKESTCGCIFKNNKKTDMTCRAGLFIDIMGLKGFTFKKIQISPKHANFMVNLGGASFEDIKETIAIVKKELRLQYGVEFETEVKLN